MNSNIKDKTHSMHGYLYF